MEFEISMARIEVAMRRVMHAFREDPSIDIEAEIELQVGCLVVESMMAELQRKGMAKVVGTSEGGERIWALYEGSEDEPYSE